MPSNTVIDLLNTLVKKKYERVDVHLLDNEHALTQLVHEIMAAKIISLHNAKGMRNAQLGVAQLIIRLIQCSNHYWTLATGTTLINWNSNSIRVEQSWGKNRQR